MWMAFQYFVGLFISCLTCNCEQGIIGVDKCVKGLLQTKDNLAG